MPDTSKMNVEEYKSFTEGQATGAHRQTIVDDYRRSRGDPPMEPPPSQELFRPGQTVWNRHTHEMFNIIAVNSPNCWCWSVSRCHYETISFDDLVADDPKKVAEPEKCPVCGKPK